MQAKTKMVLQVVYHRMLRAYGPQRWWPADDPFEVMVGAVLTQSTAWLNVEKAIRNLKAARAMSPAGVRRLSLDELAALVRPSGYYTGKARKLKAMVDWFQQSNDDLSRLSAENSGRLREGLLAVYGIGEETADCILLYAIGKPVFVIDAYTRRTIGRIGMSVRGHKYGDYQRLFMDNLPSDVGMFNEYHALFVQHGKMVCRKTPHCPLCCLLGVCDHGRSTVPLYPDLRHGD